MINVSKKKTIFVFSQMVLRNGNLCGFKYL